MLLLLGCTATRLQSVSLRQQQNQFCTVRHCNRAPQCSFLMRRPSLSSRANSERTHYPSPCTTYTIQKSNASLRRAVHACLLTNIRAQDTEFHHAQYIVILLLTAEAGQTYQLILQAATLTLLPSPAVRDHDGFAPCTVVSHPACEAFTWYTA